MNARFTRDMEAAALFQLRAALSQGLDDAGCVASATASLLARNTPTSCVGGMTCRKSCGGQADDADRHSSRQRAADTGPADDRGRAGGCRCPHRTEGP